MRIHLTLKGEMKLPIHYNHYIQSMIYYSINEDFRNFLHNKGFSSGNKQFRLFTFSSLMGNFRIEKPFIIFEDTIQLVISSPIATFIEQLGETLQKQDSIRIASNHIEIEKIRLEEKKIQQDKITIEMITPIVAYKTLVNEGKKYTKYYPPLDPMFHDLIVENARVKYESYTSETNCSFDIRWIEIHNKDEKIMRYKDFIIKGWKGVYELTGSPTILQFLYDTGLGAKNSQGFGMFQWRKDK